jgi:hypothetical protein
MAIRSPKWLVVAALVFNAPETPGVFELWDDDEVVYVGSTHGEHPSLREELVSELARHPATHFSWEISFQPAARERELLDEFEVEHHRTPRFN